MTNLPCQVSGIEARTRYDHLAGRAGVALLEAMLARGILAPVPDGGQPWNGGPPGAGATGTMPRTAGGRRTKAATSAPQQAE